LYDEAWFGAGACLEKQEKWYQALHFYNKALKLHVENAEYWKAIAHAEFKVGNIISSLDAYEEASKLDSTDKEIWLNWSFIYYEQGDYQKAIDTLVPGFTEVPDDAELFYRITVYLIEAGRFKEAFNYLENALILNFDGHAMLFDFFPQIETQKALYKIIEQFRKENS
jgi:tetratricopeptide (TPR) repeat protein